MPKCAKEQGGSFCMASRVEFGVLKFLQNIVLINAFYFVLGLLSTGTNIQTFRSLSSNLTFT
jgi:hypothetical protein